MPSFSALTSRLRRMLAGGVTTRYSRHALERMRERGVTLRDVEQILTKGQVRATDMHLRSGREPWLVEGLDLDGRRLRVVVDASEPVLILVVTVIGLG